MSGSDVSYVATEAAVKRRLQSLGCEITGETATAFLLKIPETVTGSPDIEIFVAKGIGGIGYTQNQFDELEQHLASFYIELLPL